MSRLLVIADDSSEMRWVVRTLFGDEFDDVIEVSNGRDLLSELVRCAHTRPATEVVVITDHRMPGYDGLDVLAAYDELGYYPSTVVITAYPSDEICANAERIGVALLAKPFATRDLRRLVARA